MFGACIIRRQYSRVIPHTSPVVKSSWGISNGGGGWGGGGGGGLSGGLGMATFRLLSSSGGGIGSRCSPSPAVLSSVLRSIWRRSSSCRGDFNRDLSLVTRSYAISSASMVGGRWNMMESSYPLYRNSRRKNGGEGSQCQQLTPVRFAQKWKGYTDFGHKPNPRAMSGWTLTWLLFLTSCLLGAWVDWEEVFKRLGWFQNKKIEFPKVEAAEVCNPDERDKVIRKLDDGYDAPAKKPSKLGFRDRKIIEYENRIRQYSTPDKTFRYFATLQVIHPSGDNEVFMTPDDFLRSITPGIKQPEGLGLDQFKRYDPKLAGRLELELENDSIFYRLGSHGLISFSDYVFLLTVLSTSRRHFEIAFRMFDLNGDGDVDVEEFEKVTALIRQRTSVGARHREMSVSQNSLRETNSALNSYFFGPTRKEKLTIEKFLEFQQQLQTEILNLEFRRKGPDENGRISESDFSELLLAYAGYPAKRKARMLKRVKKKQKEEGYATGVSLDDYLKFFHLLSNIQDVDTALTFYHIAGAAIDPITLKHVARTVAHVELSDHIIDVVFTLFDENQDGQLSNREFVAVMKNRLMRGLEKPKDTGFFKLLTSIGRCAKESLPR